MLTLTVNRRLALTLQEQYETQCVKDGKTTWRTLQTLPLITWIEQTWRALETTPKILLNDFQEQLIWENIIREMAKEPLLQIQSTAKLAKQAKQLLQLWEVPVSSLIGLHTCETEQFIEWHNRFEQYCKKNDLITASELPARLTQLIKEKQLIFSKKIRLAGFDDLSPAQLKLINALKKNHTVEYLTQPIIENHPVYISLSDSHQEIDAMARWAKQRAEQYPNKTVGCIIPNLTQVRDTIEATFKKLCTPEHIAFNISAAKPLRRFLMIEHGIDALHLLKNTVEVNTLFALLQSPTICHNDDDLYCGAMLDVAIRKLDQPITSIQCLFSSLNKIQDHFPQSTWPRRLHIFSEIQRSLPAKAYPSEWALYFMRALKGLGWPGTREFDTMDYQLFQRWQQCLVEFSGLDFIISTCTLQTALSILNKIINNAVFQAEGHTAPIQILGILESAGYTFDAAWIMGLSDENWPPSPKPNPFIPFSIQVKYKMPHASSERELEYTRTLHQRLTRCANEVITSAPQKDGDRPLQKSALLKDLSEISINDLQLKKLSTTTDGLYEKKELESIIDNTAPSIENNATTFGGSQVLKQQAACPFRAFALIRLKAEALQEPRLGLSAIDRGNLIHDILGRLWAKLKDQDTLKQQTPDQLDRLIQNCINQTFTESHTIHQQQQCREVVLLEKERIGKIILEWLELEKKRAPFKVIESERQSDIQLNKLKLQLRIDRIDQLPSGDLLIIDYKTGTTSMKDWFGKRPNDPQLPLYCVLGVEKNTPYNGLFFAEVNAKKVQFKGLLNETLLQNTQHLPYSITINQTKEADAFDWNEQVNAWRRNLTELADAFSEGVADVDPKQLNDTCSKCNLHSLCRIGVDNE